jgi:hypothetical protein
MAEVLKEFPLKEKKRNKYHQYYDGQCWKISPTEHDYDIEDIKAFLQALKAEAYHLGIYIKTFITLDNHIILQKRPDDYIPKRIVRKNK